jgi:replicative DNA helicase
MTPEERSLLGAIMARANVLGVALEYVQPEDFSSEAGQVIYRAMTSIAQSTDQIDPILLASSVDERVLESYGGKNFLHSLVTACPFPTNVRGYAKAVREESIDRKARSVVRDTKGTGSEYVRNVQDALYSIERREQEGGDVRSAAKSILETAGKAKPGLRYPWEIVQSHTRGMRPGWLCVLAGESGHGKTCAALQTTECAINDRKRVVYVSLEMTVRDITGRIAMRYGLDSGRFWADRMTDDDKAVLMLMLNDPKWENLRCETAASVGQLAPLCRRWKADLLVVDHLQLLVGERYEDLSKATRQLKLMAGQLDIPILLLSQLNRGEPGQDNVVPRLKRLRGSGTIEQDADTVVFVWRKRDSNEQLTGEGAMSVAKSRYGQTATSRAHFDGAKQMFTIITVGEV